MNSYKGSLLLATPSAGSDVFSRAVVYILEHNDEGAFGLILNKKNEEACAAVRRMFQIDIDIYHGGPVMQENLFFILKGEPVTENKVDLDEAYYFTEDLKAVADAYLSGALSEDSFKAFSGYSGWGPGQLNDEIENELWIPTDKIFLDYTLPGDSGLWKLIMENIGGQHILFANTPENIQYN